MKRAILGCAVLLLTVTVTVSAVAGSATVPGTDISFTPPEGFTPLTQEEMDIKFPNKNAPKSAYGNEPRTTTIAYGVKDIAVTGEMLRSQVELIGDSLARVIPGLVWVERKMVKLAGLDCAYYEMTSNAIDADIHNIMLMCAWQGKMVVFNFNATKAEFAAMESTLRASMQSIVVEKT